MTVQPDFETFEKYSREHRIVPVWRSLLSDQVTPVAVFARCVGERDGFLLESVENGERWSRWSFLGRNPLASIVSQAGELTITGPLAAEIPAGDGMLDTLETLLGTFTTPDIDELPPLHAGLMGYIGYDVVREVERLPDVPEDDLGHADGVMALIGELVAFDHWKQQVTLVANTVVPVDATTEQLRAVYDDAIDRLTALQNDGAQPLDEPLVSPPPPNPALPEVTSSMGESAYCEAVEAAKEYILSGDIFQVVLSQRFDFDLDAETFDLYRVLRQINPSPYMYLSLIHI